MYRSMIVLTALLAGGCGPQNAKITDGDFTTFMSATSSVTLRRGNIEVDEFERNYNIDCRIFDEAVDLDDLNNLRLKPRLQICPGDANVVPESFPPPTQPWVAADGFRVVGDALDTYRGEALLTAEDAVQLNFHQRLPGGDDMRFEMVFDPNFLPERCVLDENGDPGYAEIDGDWLEQWSSTLNENGDRLYLLTANATQFTEDGQWGFPVQWGAGTATARFGDDQYTMRTVQYGDPQWLYVTGGDILAGQAAASVFPNVYYGNSTPFVQNAVLPTATSAAEQVLFDMTATLDVPAGAAFGAPGGDSPRPFVSDNLWRTNDGLQPGLDGWVGLHYNWIVIEGEATYEPGSSLKGYFNLWFDGTAAPGVMLVRGSFEVDRLKKDFWVATDLMQDKLNENEAVICGRDLTDDGKGDDDE